MDKLQWEMLKRIPNEERGPITTKGLYAALSREFQGEISDSAFTRKLQRNLRILADVIGPDFVLDSPKKGKAKGITKKKLPKPAEHKVKEFSAYWRKGAPPLKVSGLSTDEVIAFGVLQKQGVNLLPNNARDALSGFFKTASTEAAAIAQENGVSKSKSKSMAESWLERIFHLPDLIAFTRPEISPTVEKSIHEALLQGSLLEIEYNNQAAIIVQPQAIIQQGVRSYLVANTRGTTGRLTNFTMHRIKRATVTMGEYVPTSISTVEKHIKKNIGYPNFDQELIGAPIELKLYVDASSQWLKETMLSENQKTYPDPKSSDDLPDAERPYYLEATVPLTERLIHWILSMSYHVEVISPLHVRMRLKNDLKLAANLY